MKQSMSCFHFSLVLTNISFISSCLPDLLFFTLLLKNFNWNVVRLFYYIVDDFVFSFYFAVFVGRAKNERCKINLLRAKEVKAFVFPRNH